MLTPVKQPAYAGKEERHKPQRGGGPISEGAGVRKGTPPSRNGHVMAKVKCLNYGP